MTLSLRYLISLTDYNQPSFLRPNGPVFNRWLPNGKEDALSIATADSRNSLTIWFERRGFVASGFIEYASSRTEVDEAIMHRQAKLDAGYLIGEAKFVHVAPSELDAVRKNLVGSNNYIALAERIIQFLYPPLCAFIDLLRLQYGQYWLNELLPWDSRTLSLGAYCSSAISLRWRESESEEWRPFEPTEKIIKLTSQIRSGDSFGSYLTKEDWREIQSSFSSTNEVPIALRVIGRAHQLFDTGHINEAFVQAVTGLELSVQHFLGARSADLSEQVIKFANQLTELPLKVQLSILAVATSLIPPATVDLAHKAIEIRNDIVHEGKSGKEDDLQNFLALVQCAKVFLGLRVLKTPVLNSGNQLSAPEQ